MWCSLHYSAAVESTGQAKAEAQSRAEAAKNEGEAAVEQAKLKAEASKIEAVSPNYIFLNDVISDYTIELYTYTYYHLF